MVERACKICRRLVKGNMCPADKSTDLTRSWRGVLVVTDANNSTLAKEAGITAPGKYAIRVK